MRFTEEQLIASEIATVDRFLAQTPESFVIERKSWQNRLDVLYKRLAAVQSLPQSLPLTLTFQGAPVAGAQSIDAAFASDAIRAIVDATDAVATNLKGQGLPPSDQLQDSAHRNLRIVDTAIGSFGFELELPPLKASPNAQAKDSDSAPFDPQREAITTIIKLLDRAAHDDDEATADLIADLKPQALDAIRDFVLLLQRHAAGCRIAFLDQTLALDDQDQLHRVAEVLAATAITESEEQHEGVLLGLLPRSRRFEARLHSGASLEGKADHALQDLIDRPQGLIGQPAQLAFRVVTVRNRRRYILTGAALLAAK